MLTSHNSIKQGAENRPFQMHHVMDIVRNAASVARQDEKRRLRKTLEPSIVVSSVMRAQGGSGMQTHFRMFLELLRKKKHPCDLVTPFDSIPWHGYPVMGARKPIESMNSTAGVWWYRHWHGHYLTQQLKRHLQKGERCVIYAQCPPSAQAALMARKSRFQRVVMVVHFNISQADEWAEKKLISPGGRLHQSIYRFEKDVLMQLDGLVFVSDFMRKALLERIPEIWKVPNIVLPNFVPDPSAGKADSMYADLITIGSLEPRKNQRYLLEIIAAAKRKGFMLSASIVGDGPDRMMLERYARQLGIQNSVRFLGFIQNAAQLLRHHKAYIHCATMENMPLTLIEALSYGTPLFAPPVGGIPEIFTDQVEGRMIPLDDAQVAAGTIVDWLSDPVKISIAGNEARKRFLAQYESNLVGDQLIRFLDCIAAENQPIGSGAPG